MKYIIDYDYFFVSILLKMSPLSIKNKTSEIAKKWPWWMVKDLSYRVYNTVAWATWVLSQEVTKMGAKFLNYGYHWVVKGVGENVVKNLKWSYWDGMVREDAFSLTKAWWKKWSNFWWKYFGRLTWWALAVGWMVLAPWHPLKRTYEAGANIISQFGLSTSHAYTNAIDMNLATAEYGQRTVERQVDGSWSRAGEWTKDWRKTLKSDWNKITREPTANISNAWANIWTTAVAWGAAWVALSDDKTKEAAEAIKKMKESEAISTKQLEEAKASAIALEKQNAELKKTLEKSQWLDKKVADLETELKKSKVDAAAAVKKATKEKKLWFDSPEVAWKEKKVAEKTTTLQSSKWLDDHKDTLTFESNTKVLWGDFDYKIISEWLWKVDVDKSKWIIRIPTDINDGMKDDVVKALRTIKKWKKIGFSEEAWKAMLDNAPSVFKHYLGEGDVDQLKKAIA